MHNNLKSKNNGFVPSPPAIFLGRHAYELVENSWSDGTAGRITFSKKRVQHLLDSMNRLPVGLLIDGRVFIKENEAVVVEILISWLLGALKIFRT